MQSRPAMDRSNRGAALLLMKVRMIAIDETREDDSKAPLSPSCKYISFADRPTSSWETDLEDSSLSDRGSPSPRCRAVSICSQDIEGSPRLSPRGCFPLFGDNIDNRTKLPELNPGSTTYPEKISSNSTLERAALTARPFPNSSSKQFVGNKIRGSVVKATLRKKFSWKTYPTLEAYLVEHRDQYLQYSARLNYTAEQKQYNNRLTQGLLDLAAEEGYIFEDYTFAAIRDRLRCYYKSYVQAIKKKSRKKKRKK